MPQYYASLFSLWDTNTSLKNNSRSYKWERKKGYTFMVVNTIYASPTENDTFNKNTFKKTLST